MKYYIADLHFGHKSIIKLCNRPFDNAEQMDEILIRNWNKTVTDKDEVYIVGDLFYHCENIEEILGKLNGKKYLIVGNHEKRWLNDELAEKYFESVHQYLEITDQNQRIFLCHYPMLSYPKQSRACMIHGHIHTDTLLDYWQVLIKRERVLNAGVDINKYKPVTLKQLIYNNQYYKQKHLNSYPQTLLSIRLNIKEIEKEGILTEEAQKQLDIYLKNQGVKQYKEGLYLVDKQNINQLIEMIHNNEAKKFFNNFDWIEVDKEGRFKFVKRL